jgi:hypothetical protein
VTAAQKRAALLMMLPSALALLFGCGGAHSQARAETLGGSRWVGTFGKGDCLDGAVYPHQAPGVTSWNFCTPDPAGSGQTVLEMAVCQTCYGSGSKYGARADEESPPNITDGASLYFSVPILVPVHAAPRRFGRGRYYGAMFAEVYGAPFRDSPTNSLDVCNNGRTRISFCGAGNTTGKHGGGQVYYLDTAPANDGQWHDFIFHLVLSTKASRGELQLWKDGVRQRFLGPDCEDSTTLTGCGTETLHYPTMIGGATWIGSARYDGSNGNFLSINNYRQDKADYLGTITYVHGAPAFGPTYASAARTLVNAPYGP